MYIFESAICCIGIAPYGRMRIAREKRDWAFSDGSNRALNAFYEFANQKEIVCAYVRTRYSAAREREERADARAAIRCQYSQSK